MSGILIFRLRRRRAVSPIIGGVIVLSLLLTALGTVVLVTQQYDQYQQTASNRAQYRNQQLSENLVAISPGLTIVNSTISGWSTSGSTCGTRTGTTEYNCYEAAISNLGTVGVQIMRIYINSTGSGCKSPNPQPCILNPSIGIAPYTFNQANQFINPGEVNYQVVFALPTGVALLDPNPPIPENTILIATSRGNVFSFQWPLQPMLFGQSNSAYSQGNMKVAYTGTTYDSRNEPGPVAGNATNGVPPSGGSGTSPPYCHYETPQQPPAGPGYAEPLGSATSPIPGLPTADKGVLWFVNPWITQTILKSGTTFYIYVIVINTGTTTYQPTAGTLDLTWYGSNHWDGTLFGVYYNGAFSTAAKAPSITPGTWYYAIFQSTNVMTSGMSGVTQSVMWWGGASITNNVEGPGFYSGTVLVSGLWIRYQASSGSCA